VFKTLLDDFTKGLWRESPTFKQVLGMCPTLAVTSSALGGLSMGLATTFVLVCSSLVVSAVRRVVPSQVRIAVYVVIIAAFVTLADYFLRAKFYEISRQLGPYVPLIVVNCIIFGRAEAFASRNGIVRSVVDALGMGTGFIAALVVLGSLRELLGSGTTFGVRVYGKHGFAPWGTMLLPAGAFVTLGCLVALANVVDARLKRRGEAGRHA